jgi:hypothetical protein
MLSEVAQQRSRSIGLSGRKALTVALVCGGTNRFLDCNNCVVTLGMTGRVY